MTNFSVGQPSTLPRPSTMTSWLVGFLLPTTVALLSPNAQLVEQLPFSPSHRATGTATATATSTPAQSSSPSSAPSPATPPLQTLLPARPRLLPDPQYIGHPGHKFATWYFVCPVPFSALCPLLNAFSILEVMTVLSLLLQTGEPYGASTNLRFLPNTTVPTSVMFADPTAADTTGGFFANEAGIGVTFTIAGSSEVYNWSPQQ